jgi:cytochrome c oxidase cbb3-type subunit 3
LTNTLEALRRLLCVASSLLVLSVPATAAPPQDSVEQNSSKQSAHTPGNQLFEANCAACHGLDGRGGEHAPDIVGAASVKSRSDTELFKIIHGGVVARGMPPFLSLGDQKICALVTHLRSLQGASAASATTGDPARGKQVFEGQGRCASCHAMKGSGAFVSTDLSDFAFNHSANEIREVILHPPQTDGPAPTSAIATTIAGDRYAGFVRNESSSSLQLQDAQGRFYLLAKSNLRATERSAAPAMPADYQQRLSKTEVEDLVSFIVHESVVSRFEDPLSTSGGINVNPGVEQGTIKRSTDSICTDH